MGIGPASTIKPYELEEKFRKLLPSQRAFIFAPERFSAIAAGFGSGKSFALLLKGLIISAAMPGGVGQFLCYRGTDVEKRLLPLFFEEVCPSGWIRSYNKKARTAVLRNNSIISFEHLHDAGGGSGAKTRRIGANLSFFGVDQAEETNIEHFNAMVSRLRLPRIPKKFGMLALNPAGRDWLYDQFFQKFQPWPRDENNLALPVNGKFFQELRQAKDTLGIVVNSEENRKSNGGFLDDSYFDSLLEQYGQEWIDRFVYGEFANFKGKIFKDYEAGLVDDSLASVHNIEPFKIPNSWSCIGGIDPGGDSPWAVCPVYVDEQSNLIVAQGFHNRTGRVSDVSNWIKSNMPWDQSRTTFVVDWENRVVLVELADYGIHCQVAQKDVFPGLLRMEGYFHVQKHRELPRWYEETQPVAKSFKFRGKGSPKIFIMKNATTVRKEFDTAKWHPDKPDQMFKSSTARWDSVEAVRYVIMTRPEASSYTDQDDKFTAMEKKDPTTAKEWKAWDRRLRSRMLNQKGQNALIEMDSEEGASPTDDVKLGKYEWDSSNEF